MTTPGLSLTQALAQHLLRPVDAETRARARPHLLDWLGCVAGAVKTRSGELVRGFDGEAVIRKAAWLGNVLEMDDVHRSGLLHPGPVIWPTVLGDTDYSMNEVLDAGIRGYEAMIAIGATFDAHHYAHFHPTSTAGVFGAAAGVGSLLELDAGELASALGLAGSDTGGLWRMRHEATDAKQLHVTNAMGTGGSAAWYARRGAKGPRFILEGEQGLYAATCRAPKPMELREGWRIAEVSFKPWAACRHAHPAIDAALELRTTGALQGEVLVETYRDALTFCDKPHPATPLEAKFSLQHAVAVVIERGMPTLGDFEPDAIAALAPARARVRVAEAAAITDRYPDHFGARVSAGGQTVELVDTLGDPERPLSREGVIEKARALMAWGGVEQDTDEAVAACLDGDDASAITALLERWL